MQLGVGCDHAMLHRHRLVTRGDFKKVAEPQHQVARLGQWLLGSTGHIEVGQVFCLVDLQQSRVQLRLGHHHLGRNAPTVPEVHDQIGRVEHGRVDRQHVPFGRHQHTCAIGIDALDAAAAEDLHHALVDEVGNTARPDRLRRQR